MNLKSFLDKFQGYSMTFVLLGHLMCNYTSGNFMHSAC